MNTHRYQTQIVKIIGEEHRNADDVFVKMRKKFPSVGIATIYRNLDKLVDDGELMKLTGVFDKTYYEKNKGPHAHLIDTERFAIVDVKLNPKSLNFPDGFVLKETQMHFVGSWEGDIPSGEISLLSGSFDGRKKDKNDEKMKETDDSTNIFSRNEDVVDGKDNEKIDNSSQSSHENNDLEGKITDNTGIDPKNNDLSGHHKTFREF